MTATLDATGLKCPLPVLRARKALRSIPSGETLLVLSTDTAAVEDFRAFCAEAAHGFVDWAQDGEVYRITIRKSG